ncbi:MAG: FmdE family protein [Armatimonadota bacterium]
MTNEHEKIDDVIHSVDLLETIRFHGHLCPGLAIGYRAAKTALDRLGTVRAEDEDLIAIVENDSCSTDAVQWLTGCTFGKGNFIFRDFGKQVFTFAIRPTGKAVRISLKQSDMLKGESAVQDREAKIHHLLSAPVEEVFDVKEMTIELPMSAQIHETLVCQNCGEGVMATRTVLDTGRILCIPCAGAK